MNKYNIYFLLNLTQFDMHTQLPFFIFYRICCSSIYSLEVFDNDKETMEPISLGKFELNPYPIHHPEGKDIALIHLKDEEESLKILTEKLGVEILSLRDLEQIYNKGDAVTFDGYVVAEANPADSQTFLNDSIDNPSTDKIGDKPADDDDARVFYPYSEPGHLNYHTRDRFFATTPEPLPEGNETNYLIEK
jgi:hypothetical protein